MKRLITVLFVLCAFVLASGGVTMAKDPKDRFQDPTELQENLKACLKSY